MTARSAFQVILVGAQEIGDVKAADLVFAFLQKDDVAGQRAMRFEVGFDCRDLRQILALVVAHAAGKAAPFADGRLEGGESQLSTGSALCRS